MTQKSIPEKLRLARAVALRACPYFGTALYSCPLIESSAVQTMAIDNRWRIYYSPSLVEAESVQSLAATLIHELLHVLRAHHDRAETLGIAGGADLRVWNIATDCEINDDIDSLITRAGWQVDMRGWFRPVTIGQPQNKTAEYYYEQLRKHTASQSKLTATINSAHDHGSGCGGPAREYEVPGPDPADADSDGATGVSPERAAVVRAATASQVRDASQRDPGSVPGGLRRWAELFGSPRVSWRDLLRSAVRHAITAASAISEPSYLRRHRWQSVLRGTVLPGVRRYSCQAACIIDTSGSISDADLAAALAEIDGVISAVGGSCDIYAGDTEISATVRSARHARDIVEHIRGGGGTDMAAIISRIDAMRRYDVIVCLTDGYTPWPASPTRARLIVALTTRDAARSVPQWANLVDITETKE